MCLLKSEECAYVCMSTQVPIHIHVCVGPSGGVLGACPGAQELEGEGGGHAVPNTGLSQVRWAGTRPLQVCGHSLQTPGGPQPAGGCVVGRAVSEVGWVMEGIEVLCCGVRGSGLTCTQK